MPNGWTGGQFSLVRVIFGAYLLVELMRHGWHIDAPVLAVVAVVGALLGAALALGWHRWPAIGLWAVLTTLAVGLTHYPLTGSPVPPSARVLLAIAALVLLAIAMLPRAPYGSWPARGRIDPAAGWRFPPPLFTAMWAIVAGMFGLWGVLLVPDLGWHVVERGMRLGAFGYTLPLAVSVAGNWLLLGAWLAVVPLALTRTTRPLGWSLVLAANVTVLPLAGYGFLGLPLVMLSLLTFDPGWLPRRQVGARETVFYDGHCGLCQRWVRFVLAEDAPGEEEGAGELFDLSPQQGDYFRDTLSADVRQGLPDSVVLRRTDGALLVRTEAVRAILHRLGGWWRVMAWLMRAIPRPMRDAAYDAVARGRRKLFAAPDDVCPVTPPHLRERFRLY